MEVLSLSGEGRSLNTEAYCRMTVPANTTPNWLKAHRLDRLIEISKNQSEFDYK